jgi:hypothetical protein
VMTDLRETDGRDQADVARTDDSDMNGLTHL